MLFSDRVSGRLLLAWPKPLGFLPPLSSLKAWGDFTLSQSLANPLGSSVAWDTQEQGEGPGDKACPGL